MTLVCKSLGIGDGIVNPMYGCGVKMAPDINPIYVGLEKSCPMDSKNVSYRVLQKERKKVTDFFGMKMQLKYSFQHK